MIGNSNVKKDYKNNWLVDSEYIKKLPFIDTYYLESLCYAINSFLKNTPIPIIAKLSKTFDVDNSIVFYIGEINKYFKVSVDYSYFDFTTLVKQWAYDYYPKYTVDYDIEVPYSDDEIHKMVKEGMDMNDAIAMRKKQKFTEIGVIEKIILKEDRFILLKNDKRYIYISGTIQKPIPLSVFKKNLFLIKDDVERKKYIDENSTMISECNKNEDVIIDHQGKQMLNFFKINEETLNKYPMQNISSFVWRCGKFVIKFSSQSLMNDCMKYIHNKE